MKIMLPRSLVILCFLIAGCVTPGGAVSKQKYNSETGKYEVQTYSRIFEGGGILVSEVLEVFIGVKLDKDVVQAPVSYSSADPESPDTWAAADMTLYFNSISSANVNFSIDSLSYVKKEYRDELISAPQQVTLIPNSTEKVEIKARPVVNNMEDIVLTLVYTHRLEVKTKEFHLRRISNDELHQRKGRDWGYFWN